MNIQSKSSIPTKKKSAKKAKSTEYNEYKHLLLSENPLSLVEYYPLEIFKPYILPPKKIMETLPSSPLLVTSSYPFFGFLPDLITFSSTSLCVYPKIFDMCGVKQIFNNRRALNINPNLWFCYTIK